MTAIAKHGCCTLTDGDIISAWFCLLSLFLSIYTTLFQKKEATWGLIITGKCGPIFKILSPIDLWENSVCMHTTNFTRQCSNILQVRWKSLCVYNFVTNQLVKEFWKLVHICQSYYQTSSGFLFLDTMYI